MSHSHALSADSSTDSSTKPSYDPVVARAERYALQAAGRFALSIHDYKHRIRNCHRSRIKAHDVLIRHRNGTPGGASFGGLQVCGSVWACPVCAARVAARRVVELQEGIESHLATGPSAGAYMLTLTISHGPEDPLPVVLDWLKAARRQLHAHRDYKDLMRSLDLVGTITATEVTWGLSSGWHPHTHAAALCRSLTPGERGQVRARVALLWRSACIRAGVPARRLPTFSRGVDFRQKGDATAQRLAEYLSKEVVWAPVKKTKRSDRYHPHDFLRTLIDTGDMEMARLYRDYIDAFSTARIRALVWSRGLRAKLGVSTEVTDEVLAAAPGEGSVDLSRLHIDAWRVFLRLPAGPSRLLEASDAGDLQALRDYVRRELTRAASGSHAALASMARQALQSTASDSAWGVVSAAS